MQTHNFFMTVRGSRGEGFSNSIRQPRYLKVPKTDEPKPSHAISKSVWMNEIQAHCGSNMAQQKKGNILFFVHGYNTEVEDLSTRYTHIVEGLDQAGFDGITVGFDWPSNGNFLGYASDRIDARRAADELMVHGIRPFAKAQTPDCEVNVHVLAHSMGCFLLREAFDYADDDVESAQTSWTVSQVALVAADMSQKSMRSDNANSRSLLRHSTRVTNYFNRYDKILSVSEVKRVGVSRRLGRVGLPEDTSEKLVNLDCSEVYNQNPSYHGTAESHRWYFESPEFYEDLNSVLTGNIDRDVIPTRRRHDDGLHLDKQG